MSMRRLLYLGLGLPDVGALSLNLARGSRSVGVTLTGRLSEGRYKDVPMGLYAFVGAVTPPPGVVWSVQRPWGLLALTRGLECSSDPAQGMAQGDSGPQDPIEELASLGYVWVQGDIGPELHDEAGCVAGVHLEGWSVWRHGSDAAEDEYAGGVEYDADIAQRRASATYLGIVKSGEALSPPRAPRGEDRS